MSDEVRPALTREEWAQRPLGNGEPFVDRDGLKLYLHDGEVVQIDGRGEQYVDVGERHWHALAALCLHGQPFGFTREDVEAIRTLLSSALCGRRSGFGGFYEEDIAAKNRLPGLANRIAALLPPEAP